LKWTRRRTSRQHRKKRTPLYDFDDFDDFDDDASFFSKKKKKKMCVGRLLQKPKRKEINQNSKRREKLLKRPLTLAQRSSH